MLAVSNLKFLKLLPGRLSACWMSDPARVAGFSTGTAPLEEFLAFHTVTVHGALKWNEEIMTTTIGTKRGQKNLNS
jgi:hypothetical protein